MRNVAYFVVMLENLKIGPEYDGFIFLAESVRNPPVLRPHRHVELELNLVVSGEIIYVVKGQRYRFGQRSLLWIFPSQEHQLVDRTPDAGYYVAVFKPDLLKSACRGGRYKILKQSRPESEGIVHTELEPDVYESLRHEMESLVQDGLDPDLLNREAGFGLSSDFTFQHNDPDFLNAGLRHLLLYSWRLHQQKSGCGREVSLHPAVNHVLDLLNRTPVDEDLDTLARQCGVSPAYLSRTFRREVGVPLTHYRNSLRLGRFWAAYRRSSRTTMLDAALEAGFGSYAQFFRVFSNAYGEGPRESLGKR
ncbi:MAG: helix-turn-helix domain-containing protein [Opitutales bacterium]